MKTNIIDIYVRPNSKEARIDGLYGNKVKIKIISAPEKGKANKELLTLLSEKLGVPRKNIEILSGITSNYKKILINSEKHIDYSKLLIGK